MNGKENMSTIVREKTGGISAAVVPPANGNGPWGGMHHSRSHYSVPVQPGKFAVWLFIAASVMLFAAFTSAYLVRLSAGDWLTFRLPSVMWFGTASLLVSSFTLHRALRAVKKGDGRLFISGMMLTVLFAAGFIAAQFAGWSQLRGTGLFLSTNPSGAFFYLLSVSHFIHVAGGMVALAYVTTRGLLGRYTERNYLGVEMTAIYWHFLDGLWLYLFIFLLVVQPG
jgi:cytochrome c oxidase subunit III